MLTEDSERGFSPKSITAIVAVPVKYPQHSPGFTMSTPSRSFNTFLVGVTTENYFIMFGINNTIENLIQSPMIHSNITIIPIAIIENIPWKFTKSPIIE